MTEMNESAPIVLKKATFNPDVRKYWLLSGALILMCTIVGIPLIAIWYLLGMWITGRYLERMECTLTEKTLIVKKGILIRVEKTIPLDKITDLGMIQGPIMRHWNIHALSVETAGSTSPGALVKLHGIEDVKEFRDRVLKQRDALSHAEGGAIPQSAAPAQQDSRVVELLEEIRDALVQRKPSE